MDWFAYENGICHCERCDDTRSSYFQDKEDWTDLQYNGILGYMPHKIKRWWKRFYILKVLKVKPFRKEDNDDLPF
jgi:hypothetical protein